MTAFRLCVLTPREAVYDGEIDSLMIPTADGEIGFLAGRERCVYELLPGDLRFRDGAGKTVEMETDGGVCEMTGERATVLCGVAYYKQEAEQKKRERASELTEERKRQERSLAEYKMTRAALMRAFEKLKRLKRK